MEERINEEMLDVLDRALEKLRKRQRRNWVLEEMKEEEQDHEIL